eukprot:scaffold68_cov340-Pavlova_lutheri.AAC.9
MRKIKTQTRAVWRATPKGLPDSGGKRPRSAGSRQICLTNRLTPRGEKPERGVKLLTNVARQGCHTSHPFIVAMMHPTVLNVPTYGRCRTARVGECPTTRKGYVSYCFEGLV